MALTKEQIRAAAMELDPEERELLAEELLQSLADEESDAIDAAWLQESHARLARLRSGETSGSSVDDVINRVKSKHRQ